MSVATVTLSSKGQIVIPKEIREQLHWHAGTQVTLLAGPFGITLKTAPGKTGRRLEDLIGMLKHEGPPLSTEALCAPVDYSEDWAATDLRSK